MLQRDGLRQPLGSLRNTLRLSMGPLRQDVRQLAAPPAPHVENCLMKCTVSEQRIQPTCHPSMKRLVSDQCLLMIEQEIREAPQILLLVGG